MTQEGGNDILEEKKETLYNWCLVNKIKPSTIIDEDTFMLNEITHSEFLKFLETREYKKDTLPQKPEKFLELRMYGLVPYNISPIQQGIQFNHANDVYSLEWGTNNEKYDWFRTEWLTNIVLNGGTSNEGHLVKKGFKYEWYIGTMQQHLVDLKVNNIKVSTFNEPDLNSMLTAIVFLVDERVFNKKLYPDYKQLPFEGETDQELAEWSIENIKRRSKWVSFIGGPPNEFLRDFLSDKKLA
tara:strand:+ start:1770 stop:2492 length:723 start_codon:yes stop_codon:yes gene_type:complete